MTQWDDITSYTRAERASERVEPRTWSMRFGDDEFPFSVIVTRNIRFGADVWVMSFRGGGIHEKQLKNKDIELAKDEALRISRERAAYIYKHMCEVPKKKTRKKVKE